MQSSSQFLRQTETLIGRKKEKHVKNTVLMSLLTVAGLAASAQAQNPSIQVQLVLDNDPRLIAIMGGYGTRALLPGPTATAVGVTLIARATTEGTFANLGITAMGGGGSSSAPNSVFRHNDATSNTTTALWTSPALAFQRGHTGSSGNNRGLMFYGSGNTAHNFRSLISGGVEGSNPSSNNSNPAPSDNPYNPQTSGAGAHINGFVGLGGAGAPSGGLIIGATGQRAGITDDGSGENPIVNYGGDGTNDQDANAAGNQSEWVAMYHLIFVPRANNGGVLDMTRDVTVTFSGFFRYGTGSGSAGGAYTFVSSGLFAGGGSITFQVPTPGAMALLGLGGLVAGRRRRA